MSRHANDCGPPTHDVVIVGSGFAGAIIAKQLTRQGHTVLVLEAGTGTSATWNGYRELVENFQAQTLKVPNSPYPLNPNAPSPSVADAGATITPDNPTTSGYFVQTGPKPFASDYLRMKGGTSLHWLGHYWRMMPADFDMQKRYGRGRDWPIGYKELQRYYELAEWEAGVSATAREQSYGGIEYSKDYEYPMENIPLSYISKVLKDELETTPFVYDGAANPIHMVPTPQARNSTPRKGVVDPRSDKEVDYSPIGAVGAPGQGQRCEGNSSCIPICPVQAKYNSMKTLAQAVEDKLEVRVKCVASRIVLNESRKHVTGIEYKQYEDKDSPDYVTRTAVGTYYVIAAHSVETAKLLLASDAANSSDQVGRNLMDHPYLITSAAMPEPVGPFRGPCMTTNVVSERDGKWRGERAAFLVDIVNWGWNYPGGAPNGNVTSLVDGNIYGKDLRRQLGQIVPRQLSLGFLVEQLPEPTNRVTLDPNYLDALGNYRPVIAYNVSDYTRAGFAAATAFSNQVYARMGATPATNVPDFSPGESVEYDGASYSYHAAGHLVGTTRMGDHRHDSVVNPEQRTWDHDNLFLAGCGNMPTIGTTNPTETMAAIAFLVAERIGRLLK